MKKIFLMTMLFIVGIGATAVAQNKAVVIPLISNRAAGIDGQFQYNDGGKNAGAEVYYDKATGNFGIGTTTPNGPLTIKSPGSFYGSASHGLRLEDVSSSNGWNLHMSTADEMYLAYNGSLRLYLNKTTATNWMIFSDERLKKDVLQSTYGLSEVLALDPILFRYATQSDEDSYNLGFIAQDVEVLIPELVSTSASGYKGLNYGSFTPVLVQAIQEQQEYIEQLEAANEILKTDNIKMKEDINQIKVALGL